MPRYTPNTKVQTLSGNPLIRELFHGMTYGELERLCHRADIDFTTTWRWRSNRSHPSLFHFMLLADAAGYDVKLVKREALPEFVPFFQPLTEPL